MAAKVPDTARFDVHRAELEPNVTLTVPWGLPSPETPVTVPLKVSDPSEPKVTLAPIVLSAVVLPTEALLTVKLWAGVEAERVYEMLEFEEEVPPGAYVATTLV